MFSRVAATFKKLGPWPIRAKEIGFIVAFYILTSAIIVEVNVNPPEGEFKVFQALSKVLLPSVILGALVYAILALASNLTKKYPHRTEAIYMAASLIMPAALVPSRWILIDAFSVNLNGEFTAGFPIFWISMLFFYAINIAMGTANAKLAAEVERTQTLLHEVEVQRSKIIEAQEQVRKEIATYLHDGLQSQLVVLGLQMRNAVKNLPAEQAAIANSFIEEIEHIRRVDVRKASQQLSPDLMQISVASAIRDIADRYSPEVKVSIGIDSTIQSPALPERIKLALYRITEQVLLNAAAHGHARNVWLSIAAQGDSFDFQIANDGAALTEQVTAGGGAAIISSWVDYLNGSWSLTQEPGQHVLFQAKLTLPQITASN